MRKANSCALTSGTRASAKLPLPRIAKRCGHLLPHQDELADSAGTQLASACAHSRHELLEYTAHSQQGSAVEVIVQSCSGNRQVIAIYCIFAAGCEHLLTRLAVANAVQVCAKEEGTDLEGSFGQ